MVHDFAKIRPEPVLEYGPVEAPPSWMLLFTGLITGIAVGVFACFLFYLSGKVPPLQTTPVSRVVANDVTAEVATDTTALDEAAPNEIQLDFYQELQDYEVIVDVTPVEIESNSIDSPASIIGFMLQSGAYEQRASADTQLARLQALGLKTEIRQEKFPTRTLYLVQSGPFSAGDQLNNAESLLRRNNIDSIKIGLQ